MTSNTLKRLDIERQARADAETRRRNQAQEDLADRENLAKYGYVDYITTGTDKNNPFHTTYKVAQDLFSSILSPITSTIKSFKGGR